MHDDPVDQDRVEAQDAAVADDAALGDAVVDDGTVAAARDGDPLDPLTVGDVFA